MWKITSPAGTSGWRRYQLTTLFNLLGERNRITASSPSPLRAIRSPFSVPGSIWNSTRFFSFVTFFPLHFLHLSQMSVGPSPPERGRCDVPLLFPQSGTFAVTARTRHSHLAYQARSKLIPASAIPSWAPRVHPSIELSNPSTQGGDRIPEV